MAVAESRRDQLHDMLIAACKKVGLSADGASLITYSSNAVFRLDAGVVVRINVTSQAAPQARHLVDVARWLETSGAPIAPLWPTVEQPTIADGWAATFWVELDRETPPTATELAATLRTFHAITPRTDLPYWDKFQWARDLLAHADAIADEDLIWLRNAWLRSEADFTAQAGSMPHGLIHGDAHTGNLLRTPSDNSVLCDLDNVTYGPLDWDLTPNAVSALRFNQPHNLSEFVEVYGRNVTLQPWWPVLRMIRELVMVTYIVNDLNSRPEMKREWNHRMDTLKGGRTDALWTIIK